MLDCAAVQRWVAGYEAAWRAVGTDALGEVFTLATEVVAVDGDTAVVRTVVRYGEPMRQACTDLGIVRLDDRGQCSWFEEGPYWPGRPWSAGED